MKPCKARCAGCWHRTAGQLSLRRAWCAEKAVTEAGRTGLATRAQWGLSAPDPMLCTMIGRLHTVAIDCPDPNALAAFYSELLGLPVTKSEGDWVVIGGPEQPRIAFQLAPDHQPPAWPDPRRPQQVHFDIEVDDIDTAEERVIALGARLLAREEDNPDDLFRVYTDPAGHPFCLEFTR